MCCVQLLGFTGPTLPCPALASLNDGDMEILFGPSHHKTAQGDTALHCSTLHYSTIHTTIYFIVHTAQRALQTAHCTLHISHCTVHTAQCTLHTSQCTLHTSHYKLQTAHSTLHTSHCTLHTAHHSIALTMLLYNPCGSNVKACPKF